MGKNINQSTIKDNEFEKFFEETTEGDELFEIINLEDNLNESDSDQNNLSNFNFALLDINSDTQFTKDNLSIENSDLVANCKEMFGEKSDGMVKALNGYKFMGKNQNEIVLSFNSLPINLDTEKKFCQRPIKSTEKNESKVDMKYIENLKKCKKVDYEKLIDELSNENKDYEIKLKNNKKKKDLVFKNWDDITYKKKNKSKIMSNKTKEL